MKHVVSLSGGKDSVALWLWARRTGLDPVAVYQDTGWEWDGHYKHLDLLEARIGPIVRLKPPLTFEEQTAKKQMFPKAGYGGQGGQWCTRELKLNPFRAWLRENCDLEETTVLLGIRREESAKRADPARTPEREHSDFHGCEVWRPILDWPVEQVIAEHRRAAIPMHPLYHLGAERVGCWPCIHASKAELGLLGRIDPERVARVRALEAATEGTMFTRDRRTEKRREIKRLTSDGELLKMLHADALARGIAGDEQEADVARQIEKLAGPSVVPIGIDEVIAWAGTARGGKQIALVKTPSGCARWGTCEAAPTEEPEATR
jgi:3'-phosphoadenosine 5'-phosphosulfate sulfotransferase (PAPS reductase)/FAD synthetase